MSLNVSRSLAILMKLLRDEHDGALVDHEHHKARYTLSDELSVSRARIGQLLNEGVETGLIEHESARGIGTSRVALTHKGKVSLEENAHHWMKPTARRSRVPIKKSHPQSSSGQPPKKPTKEVRAWGAEDSDSVDLAAEAPDHWGDEEFGVQPQQKSAQRSASINKDSLIIDLRTELGCLRTLKGNLERELKAASAFIAEVRGGEISDVIRQRDAAVREKELATKAREATLNSYSRVCEELEIERQRGDNLRRALTAERMRSRV